MFRSQFSNWKYNYRVSRDNFYHWRKSLARSGKVYYAVETRVHNTSREETIDCKSFLFLCNVDAKIDGKLLRKGRTLISSTRYSFPFEKVVSINMTRYSATFSNNEFSFSRFFFFFFSSSYLFDAAQVLHTFLRYYYRDINIRMTEKDMINELENSLFISILFIV